VETPSLETPHFLYGGKALFCRFTAPRLGVLRGSYKVAPSKN